MLPTAITGKMLLSSNMCYFSLTFRTEWTSARRFCDRANSSCHSCSLATYFRSLAASVSTNTNTNLRSFVKISAWLEIVVSLSGHAIDATGDADVWRWSQDCSVHPEVGATSSKMQRGASAGGGGGRACVWRSCELVLRLESAIVLEVNSQKLAVWS